MVSDADSARGRSLEIREAFCCLALAGSESTDLKLPFADVGEVDKKGGFKPDLLLRLATLFHWIKAGNLAYHVLLSVVLP